jgi:hypothetical protein
MEAVGCLHVSMTLTPILRDKRLAGSQSRYVRKRKIPVGIEPLWAVQY